MRFTLRPYLCSAALLLAPAAHAEGRSTSAPAPTDVAPPADTEAAASRAAPCRPESPQPARPVGHGVVQGAAPRTVIMVAPGAEDPFVEQVWSAP